MINGFKVQYSQDTNQVCIIPNPFIPVNDFVEIIKMFGKLGYKWWLPADERCGFIYAKEVKNED